MAIKPKIKFRYGLPIKLKPSRVHKSKKIYNRKKEKVKAKNLI